MLSDPSEALQSRWTIHPLREPLIEAVEALEQVELDDGIFRRAVYIVPERTCALGCVVDDERCFPGSGGYHGSASREVFFLVAAHGRGAVAFEMHSPIYPVEANVPPELWHPIGPVTTHRTVRGEYDSEDPIECHWTGTGQCYGSGSWLQADRGVEVFLDRGYEGVWSWLAEEWLPAVVGASA